MMPDPLIPPRATIRVWTCEECGRWWPDPPDQHWFEWNECRGTPTERVYVDLAAVDREAWVERIAELFAERDLFRAVAVDLGPLADQEDARAVVDAILGPEGRP